MNTGYGRYGAAYNMVGFSEELLCVWVELLLLPKNPTKGQSYKLQVHGVNPQSPLKV
jgi:hypothetical protein